MRLRQFAGVAASRGLKAWKFVMTILAVPSSASSSAGTRSRLLVVVVRVGRQQDAQAVADGDAGGDDEEGVGEPAGRGIGAAG